MTATPNRRAPVPTLWDAFSRVPDRRAASGRRYPLPALLTIALAALLSGRRSQAAITRWGRGLGRAELRALGIRERRGPCAATWCVFFQTLDIGALEQALAAWARGTATQVGHIAVDGKRLRGARDGDGRAVHLLAAYGTALRAVLGTEPVAPGPAEAAALLALLSRLPLEGAVLTMDAAFTHRPVAEAVTDAGGDYVMLVKANQEMLRRDIAAVFGPPSPLGPASARPAAGPGPGHERWAWPRPGGNPQP